MRLCGGSWDSNNSPSPLVLGFGGLGIGDRACQYHSYVYVICEPSHSIIATISIIRDDSL